MRDTMVRRYLPLVYVAAVTALLLALVIEQSRRGPGAFPGLVVYALAAGFGLEFVRSGWAEGKRPPGNERRLPH